MDIRSLGSKSVAALFLCLPLHACGGNDDGGNAQDAGTRDSAVQRDSAIGEGDASTDAAVGDATASDGAVARDERQSAAIITTVNMGEIALAQLALMEENATEESVRDYAELMVDHHTTAQTMLTNLLESEEITPMANEVSSALQSEATRVQTMLTPLSGAAFDTAYIQSQVAMHAMVLEIIDTQLLPGADDGEFRTFLTSVRATVLSHHELAEEILSELSS